MDIVGWSIGWLDGLEKPRNKKAYFDSYSSLWTCHVFEYFSIIMDFADFLGRVANCSRRVWLKKKHGLGYQVLADLLTY